jgi:hypothetical protein
MSTPNSLALDLLTMAWDQDEVSALVMQIVADPTRAEERLRKVGRVNGASWVKNGATTEALELLDEDLPDSIFELSAVLDFEPVFLFSVLDIEIAEASERCSHAMGRAFVAGALEARAR